MSAKLAIISVALFSVLVTVTAYRVIKDFNTPVSRAFDVEHRGYCDFHVATYYASRAFREGVSPFTDEAVEQYPFERELPLYSPLMLFVHLPFTYLPLKVAAAVHFVCNIGLMTVLGWMGLKFSGFVYRWPHVLLAASFVLLTRCGHVTIFTGYVTAELAIGTIVALQYGRNKPWLGALGLVVAGFKPTYAIPLVFLMLCRRQWKSVSIGVSLALAALFLGFSWLALHSSWKEVIESVGSTQQVHVSQEALKPENTWTRVDAFAIIAKWTKQIPSNSAHLVAMLPLLFAGGFGVWRLNRSGLNENAASLSSMLIIVTMLVSLYHHSYDCLTLVVPLAGLVFCRLPDWRMVARVHRWMIGFATFALLFSYWSTSMFLDRLQPSEFARQIITSVNGILLLYLFCALLLAAIGISSKSIREKARMQERH